MGANLNRFLFDTLTFLNGFIAVVIMLSFSVISWSYPELNGASPVGLVVGALVGLAIAAFICGTISFMALIERHLRTIAGRYQSDGLAPLTVGRQEPRM